MHCRGEAGIDKNQGQADLGTLSSDEKAHNDKGNLGDDSTQKVQSLDLTRVRTTRALQCGWGRSQRIGSQRSFPLLPPSASPRPLLFERPPPHLLEYHCAAKSIFKRKVPGAQHPRRRRRSEHKLDSPQISLMIYLDLEALFRIFPQILETVAQLSFNFSCYC